MEFAALQFLLICAYHSSKSFSFSGQRPHYVQLWDNLKKKRVRVALQQGYLVQINRHYEMWSTKDTFYMMMQQCFSLLSSWPLTWCLNSVLCISCTCLFVAVFYIITLTWQAFNYMNRCTVCRVVNNVEGCIARCSLSIGAEFISFQWCLRRRIAIKGGNKVPLESMIFLGLQTSAVCSRRYLSV